MREQHLDLLSSSSALIVSPRVTKVADGLAGFLIHVTGDGSERRIGAGFPDRASATGSFACEVPFDAIVFPDPAQWHLVAFQTGVAVPIGIILEMADVVLALGLVLAVEHRDMRRHLALQ